MIVTNRGTASAVVLPYFEENDAVIADYMEEYAMRKKYANSLQALAGIPGEWRIGSHCVMYVFLHLLPLCENEVWEAGPFDSATSVEEVTIASGCV